jgi:hypothetical protein
VKARNGFATAFVPLLIATREHPGRNFSVLV